MGRFHLVYYISMGTPSIEASLQMAETYLAHGVSALQFDLPSRNPYRETLFIRKRMAKAWETYGGYEPFLTALTEFRRKHPDFEMQMVSYEDVILTIGTVRYIEFCKQNNIKTCRISGDGVIELARMDMNAVGIDTLTFIDYNLPEKDVEFAVQTGRCPASAFALLLPMIFALFVAELYRRHENPLGNVCWELGGLVYIALPFALLATIPLRGACSAGSSYVPGDMLAIIFIVWANDVGAYLAGSLFGRHRLFERISPKKSWEGFAGGVLCAVAVGWLYGLYAGPGDTAHGLLWSGAGLVVAVAGVLGDLVESMLKRSAGLKDSGNSIPGHGGFLDRFDALILAVPFVYAYFAIFAYICVLSGGPVGAVAG